METVTDQLAVFGTGYEGAALDAFIDGLLFMKIRLVADIRLNPISRKRGFSKRMLADALESSGIDYIHMPELGNPKWNRAGFGGPDAELLHARRSYSSMIASPSAESRLDEILAAARDGAVALMCFEAKEQACHRYVVLEELQRRMGLTGAPRPT